ncbi:MULTISPECIES: hypothetical protein [unclassified Micromonospora]|uniref:hypothetical protein n=1 Tax=unclassified Micromonospora TaxID=2617518 RepID=UPI001C24F42B|nr:MULTISPECIES: hypothetical protein [unclassified Micromonospora]MBU8855828.1 hypothetical protein [Micromonospora sp. WMMB482]MBU8861848.1 hypothetical protein [Micromonospora sp. WMMB482]MDM4781428.1 hypothetical protein [Micromonospora sp. b486]
MTQTVGMVRRMIERGPGGGVVGLLLLAALLGGCRAGEPRDAGRPGAGGDGHAWTDRSPGGEDRHTVAADRGDLRSAVFVLVDGADAVRVRTADLGDDLYRVSTPTGAKVRPAVSVSDGTVTAGLAAAGGAGPALVEVALHDDVRWRVRLGGGAQEEVLDLRGGRIEEVELTAGTSRAEVTLPPAERTVRLAMTGGASRLLVHLAGDAPVRVRVAGGAGRMSVDGAERTGVAGGTVLTPSGWDTATDRYDVDAVAGVSDLVVDRT